MFPWIYIGRSSSDAKVVKVDYDDVEALVCFFLLFNKYLKHVK